MRELTIDTIDGPIHVTHLTRDDWGGGPVRKGYWIPTEQVEGWVLHHTVATGPENGDIDAIGAWMRQLQAMRPDLGSEVPYSVIPFRGATDDSVVLADGRGPNRTGAHTAGLNSTRYAWSLPGDYRFKDPTVGQIWGMRWIAGEWTPHASVGSIGHQQAPPYWVGGTNLNATACPGDLAPLLRLQPPFVGPASGIGPAEPPLPPIVLPEDPEMTIVVKITEAVRDERELPTDTFLFGAGVKAPALNPGLTALADPDEEWRHLDDGASRNFLDAYPDANR
ncbi:MAG: hypothetical protein ACF8PN_08155 [Phycisphaerales bacterium]